MIKPSRITGQTAPTPDSDMAEALHRVVAGQIGPRRPGLVYDNVDGVFEVIEIHTATEARRILKRRAAQFAVTVLNVHTSTVHTTGAVWTGSDRVLKAVA